ncbi:MAG TPA: hypothetical protein VMJ64_02095, partial [Anaerolineales bacterium]|nr:hypothetical protein [Anaerolineales bacterium]
MTSILELLKRPIVLIILGVLVGLIVGIPIGWATVTFENTTPEVMRPDLQEDYMRMAIMSFQVDQNADLAVWHWDALGSAAAPMYAKVQADPRNINPTVIQTYGQVISSVKGPEALTATSSTSTGTSPITIVLVALLLIILVGAAIGAIFLRRLLR